MIEISGLENHHIFRQQRQVPPVLTFWPIKTLPFGVSLSTTMAVQQILVEVLAQPPSLLLTVYSCR